EGAGVGDEVVAPVVLARAGAQGREGARLELAAAVFAGDAHGDALDGEAAALVDAEADAGFAAFADEDGLEDAGLEVAFAAAGLFDARGVGAHFGREGGVGVDGALEAEGER